MRRLVFLLAIALLMGCTLGVNPDAATISPTLSPAPSPTPDSQFQINVHPDGSLYVGDQVSFEVITPTDFDANGREVEIRLDDQIIGKAAFTPYGIAGRQQATLWWAWDTSALEPGAQLLSFSVVPDGPSWQESIHLLPPSDIPEFSARCELGIPGKPVLYTSLRLGHGRRRRYRDTGKNHRCNR